MNRMALLINLPVCLSVVAFIIKMFFIRFFFRIIVYLNCLLFSRLIVTYDVMVAKAQQLLFFPFFLSSLLIETNQRKKNLEFNVFILLKYTQFTSFLFSYCVQQIKSVYFAF